MNDYKFLHYNRIKIYKLLTLNTTLKFEASTYKDETEGHQSNDD